MSKPSEQDILFAHYISEKLNSEGTKIWLTYGSSLGAVREGKMIEGDETDLDMMMWEEDKDKLMEVIKNSPYRVSWDFRHFNNGGEVCKLTLGEKMLPKEGGTRDHTKFEEGKRYCVSCLIGIPNNSLNCKVCEEYGNQFHIDVYFLKRTSDNIKCYDSVFPDVYLKSYHYDNLRKIKFENLDFYVSKYAEDTLDFFYNGIDGTDNTWRVPIKKDIYHSEGYDCGNVSGRKGNTLTCYVEGVFDLFHVGHLRLIKKCSKIFDEVVVGVHSDETVLQYKGVKPVIPYEHRVEMIKSCKFVDEVIEAPLLGINGINGVEFLNDNNLDYLIHGETNCGLLEEQYPEITEEHRLFLLSETPDYHTKDLIEILKQKSFFGIHNK